MPPSHRSRLLYGVGDTAFSEGADEDSGIAESVAAEDLFPERFRIKSTGTRTAAPIRERRFPRSLRPEAGRENFSEAFSVSS